MDDKKTIQFETEEIFEIIGCPDCTLEVDIILKSSEGDRFAAHSKNLERFSEGFPPACFNWTDAGSPLAVVQLEESSKVVKLMLQYMHLKPQPDIERIPFSVLDELANAVEKYLIYSAIVVCRLCMRDNTSSYPLSVLRYASKHGYKALADEAARHTIDKDFKEMKAFFGTDSRVVYQWVGQVAVPVKHVLRGHSTDRQLAYREPWMSALPLVYTKDPPIGGQHKGGYLECELWKPFHDKVLREVECSAVQMARFDKLVSRRITMDLGSCERCIDRARKWISAVNKKIGDVPTFSECL